MIYIGSEKLAIFGGNPVFKKKIPILSMIGKEEKEAVFNVLESGILSQSRQGYYVGLFENSFAQYFKNKYAVSTSSGTTALHTAICTLGIGSDDEVLVPALTFVSTASVVLQEGARPVFVDINPDTFNIDMGDLEKKITKKTKAIIIVHLYGNPNNAIMIEKIAKKYKLIIIEDCAQAHGALFKDEYVGGFGDISCFSFQQSKNMICGEGGMVITNNKNLYKKYLRDTELIFQKETDNSQSTYYCLTALLPERFKNKRDWFVEALRAENAEILRLYPLSLPQTKLFKRESPICPVAMNVSGRLFNFLTNPGITEEYVKKTCKAVRKVLNYMYEQGAK